MRTLTLALSLTALAVAAQAKAETWGAIAYGSATGNWGYYFNSPSQQDADSRAVGYCQQSGGRDCVASVWFTGCGSLARSSSNKWATAYGNSAGEARSAALLQCARFGGTDCRTLVMVCAEGGVVPIWAPTPIYTNLNKAVVAYAVAHLGQEIGNGECWTLVNEGLGAAGARQPNTGGLGLYEFGSEAYGVYAVGDILQFEGVEFQYANGAHYSYPHHTAIIESVNGNVINLLNQNVNNDRHVQRTSIDLSARTSGTIRVYQPEPR